MINFFAFFQLFINNQFVDSKSGKTFPVVNPANGKVIVNVSEGDKVRNYYYFNSSLTLILSWCLFFLIL